MLNIIYRSRARTVWSKIEVPRIVRNSKYENMTSTGENGLNIRTIKSQMGQNQVSGGVSILYWIAATVAMFYGNLPTFGNTVKSVIRSFTHWCNVWLIEGVTVYGHVPECHEKKEEIWLSPMTKAPTPTEMSKRLSDNTNNATKKFDYTAVADQLRTVSWSNYSHPTGVFYRFYRAHLPTHLHSCVIEGMNMTILLYSDIRFV